MSIDIVKTYLRDYPGYLKWGSKKLARKLGVMQEEVLQAMAELRIERAASVTSESTVKGGVEPPAPGTDTEYEKFIKEGGINPDDVVSVKHWQNMGGSRRFSVVTKNGDGTLTDNALIENLHTIFAEYKHPEFNVPFRTESTKCAVLNMFDAHIDKICLSSECSVGDDQTLDERFNVLSSYFDEVLAGIVPHSPEVIFFPVGSDFWTTNGIVNATAKGTEQRVLAPHEEVFTRGVRFYMECVDKLQQVAQKVIVITLKGNHDPQPVFYLGVALELVYANSDRVEVHSTRHQRKYFSYGRWGFGFGHGDNEKKQMDRMPLWFATEGKEIWYRAEACEFFLGDIHHKEEYRFKRGYDGIGMYAYFLRGTTGTDMWHSDSGYVGIPKSIEAFIYEKTTGHKSVVSVSW